MSLVAKFVRELKLSLFYDFLFSLFQRHELAAWQKRGQTPPTPHIIKQKIVKEYALKYSLATFVETGTYLGTMVAASKNIFKSIITIEIDETLYKRAKKKFFKYKHIRVLKGDSARVLPKIIKQLKEPSLFWLDAHYSKGITGKGKTETPIEAELKHIFNSKVKKHVVLIDDADNFSGQNDYPTLKKLRNEVKIKNSKLKFYVKQGIIFIHP